MKGSKEKKNMSVTAVLIPMYQRSPTSVRHVGGRGAAANSLPVPKLQDHGSANMIIDRNTKGGLR